MAFFLGRRALFRAGLGAAAATGLRGLVFADAAPAPDPGLLVLVFLRGGMDGLHFLSPADDPDFVELRASELRTAAEGAAAGHRIDASPAVDFRLHRNAGPLARIWREGRMAIWPAAGLPEPTRSHFEAQAIMGLGRGWRRERAGARGWLGAWAAASGRSAPLALAPQAVLPAELRGFARAVGVPGLEGGLDMPHGAFGETVLKALHAGTEDPVAAAGRDALDIFGALSGLLPRGEGGRVLPYAPANAADYSPGLELGRALAVVARLAKLAPRITAAAVDFGGWDTHEAQGHLLAVRVEALARALDAFDRDMADLPRRWSVAVETEFGRRVRANRSGGTDHGRAATLFGFGGPGFGLGRHFGPWPGLSPDALEDGVDLRVATDYRDALRRLAHDLVPADPPNIDVI